MSDTPPRWRTACRTRSDSADSLPLPDTTHCAYRSQAHTQQNEYKIPVCHTLSEFWYAKYIVALCLGFSEAFMVCPSGCKTRNRLHRSKTEFPFCTPNCDSV